MIKFKDMIQMAPGSAVYALPASASGGAAADEVRRAVADGDELIENVLGVLDALFGEEGAPKPGPDVPGEVEPDGEDAAGGAVPAAGELAGDEQLAPRDEAPAGEAEALSESVFDEDTLSAFDEAGELAGQAAAVEVA